MKLAEIIKLCNLRLICGDNLLDREVSGGYVSDLLSDVMANSKKGDIWITLQVHPNIVAVALLKEITGIIMVNGRKPEEETVKKANEERLPVMTTDMPAFEVVGKLYNLGIRGKH
jgi:predicted transcriptional regulator